MSKFFSINKIGILILVAASVFALGFLLIPNQIHADTCDTLYNTPIFNPFPVTYGTVAGCIDGNAQDFAVVSAGIHNSNSWSPNLTTQVGDQVTIMVYVHNGAASNSGAVMNGVSYNTTQSDSSDGTTHTFTTTLSASNAESKTGSVTINTPAGSTLRIDSGSLNGTIGDLQPCFEFAQINFITLTVVGPSAPPVTPTANLTINDSTTGSFTVGNNWTLKLSTNLPNTVFALCGTQTPPGTPSCSPNFGTTDASGNWTTSGTFTDASIGSWVEYADFAAVDSNQISFTVSAAGGGGGGGGGGGTGGGGGGIGGRRRTPPLAPGGEILGATSCFYLRDFLKIDWQNDPVEVLKLQSFLNVFEGENLSLTGVFEETTFAAVQRFQVKYHTDILVPWGNKVTTGFVYILTKKKVNEIFCNTQFPVNAAEQAEIDAFRAAGESFYEGFYDGTVGGAADIGRGIAEGGFAPTTTATTSTTTGAIGSMPAGWLNPSVVKNAAISLLAFPQKLFNQTVFLILLLILILIAIVLTINRFLKDSQDNLTGKIVSFKDSIMSFIKGKPGKKGFDENGDSSVITLPGEMPDEEIIVENPEEEQEGDAENPQKKEDNK